MLTALIVLACLVITVTAFCMKDLTHRTMLHAVAMLGWMVITWMWVRTAISTYEGMYQADYIPTAIGLFGISMVLVEVVAIILPYLKESRTPSDAYRIRQSEYRLKIAGMTKKKQKMWWEN